MVRKAKSTRSHKRPPLDTLSAEAENLREKYQTLCAKYAQLVKKFEIQRMDRIAVYSLARWALRTDSSGIAVVHQRAIEVFNDHFRTLSRVAGPWRRIGTERERVQSFRDLRELVIV